VIGMHRSGTSATAAVLGRLGLASPPARELVPATATNRHGHVESRTLLQLNNRLLRVLGGTWSAPPRLSPGWERADDLGPLRTEASSLFTTVFPRLPAAWKDPRNCILLPFWRTVVPPPAAAVLVYRDPLEVAGSLRRRDGIPLTGGLAIWERYLRAACANLDGLPTLCSDYHSLVDDPAQWCTTAASFLARLGVVVEEERIAQASDSVDRTLRHERRDAEAESDGKPGAPEGAGGAGWGESQGRILETLRSRHGAHHPWHSPDLGSEPDWVGDVLDMQLEIDLLQRSQDSLAASRAHRVAAGVQKLRRWWR